MTRYAMLEAEINKNIVIDEKNNVIIDNWTPNNLRRLIIGNSQALVQYYITGGKYKNISELVKFGNKIDNDLLLLENNNYSSILRVLTSKRIISSIEEIIFCSNNYNAALLNVDVNSWLLKEKSKLKSRFVRLHNISIVDCSVLNVASLIRAVESPDKLLIEELKKKYPVTVVERIHENDWYMNTSMRERWYTMDKENGKLYQYFRALKLNKEEELKEKKLQDIELDNTKKLLNEHRNKIFSLINNINKNLNTMNKISNTLSMIEKSEWGLYLTPSFIKKMLLNKYDNTLEDIRSIDIEKIISILKVMNEDELSKELIFFNDILYNKVLKKENYKANYKKSDIKNSIKKLINLLNFILYTVIFSSCNLTFISYVSREGIKYVDYHVDILNLRNSLIKKYTKNDIEIYNAYEDKNKIHKVHNKLFFVLVKQENYTLLEKRQTISNMLDTFKNIYLS
ncbi:hypothetical protein QEW_4489 [Clostridioides difficile CD160]|nr:hypothetical protein QEW_4489 [Clostridioides difficile CD160]